MTPDFSMNNFVYGWLGNTKPFCNGILRNLSRKLSDLPYVGFGNSQQASVPDPATVGIFGNDNFGEEILFKFGSKHVKLNHVPILL